MRVEHAVRPRSPIGADPLEPQTLGAIGPPTPSEGEDIVGHEAHPGGRNPNVPAPAQRVDVASVPAGGGPPARRRRPELRLQVVGGNRIDVAAIGNFDAASHDAVAARLERLVAGGPGSLHVDCSRIDSIDRTVAALFASVGARLMNETATPDVTAEQTSVSAVAP